MVGDGRRLRSLVRDALGRVRVRRVLADEEGTYRCSGPERNETHA